MLPHVIHWAMRQETFTEYRHRLIPAAEGRVLEIGAGSGVNLPFCGRSSSIARGRRLTLKCTSGLILLCVTLEPGARPCPGCGQQGTAVQLQTVKALLTEVALRRIQLTHYRFCGNGACDVVYFGAAGDCFGAEDIRVLVWQKQSPGSRLLCYCFGDTETVIRAELLRSGRTDVVDRIREHIAAQRCACDIRNPRGACCLGDVIAALRRIEAEVSEGRTNNGVLTNVPDR
jgi:hypothetical protein